MKLSPWTIIIIGICTGLIALSAGFFLFWNPNISEAKMLREHNAKLQEQIDQEPQAEQRVKAATEEVQDIAHRWQQTVATRTPPPSVPLGGISLAVNRYQLTVDARKFRNSIQRAINRQVRAGGVTVISGPEIPSPTDDPATLVETYFNYPALGFPVAIFDLGTVTVQGTFEQIAANMSAWSRMPNYLAVADGLQITGTSPRLTGTYQLSIVAYIRGKIVHPQIPQGTAESAAAATTGATTGAPTTAAPSAPPSAAPRGSGGAGAGAAPNMGGRRRGSQEEDTE
jgi:hypothetical protein